MSLNQEINQLLAEGTKYVGGEDYVIVTDWDKVHRAEALQELTELRQPVQFLPWDPCPCMG